MQRITRRFILFSCVCLTALGFYQSWRQIVERVIETNNNEEFSVPFLSRNVAFFNASIAIRSAALKSKSNEFEYAAIPPTHLPSNSQAFFVSPFTNVNSPSSSNINASSLSQQPLICLRHHPTTVRVRDVAPNGSVFSMQMKMRDGCGPLRRDWSDNPPLSPLAQVILHQQSNCSLPVITWEMIGLAGIGSSVSRWSQAMCYAWENGMRLRSHNPEWLWRDKSYCKWREAKQSPWLCYFPKLEYLCGRRRPELFANVTNLRLGQHKVPCQHEQQQPGFLSAFRAAAVEYMFRSISPLVIQEAQRQIGVVFGPNGAPNDLITVHVRWGDKYREMELVAIEKYINAVWRLLLLDDHDRGRSLDKSQSTRTIRAANIYLATEDVHAANAFVQAAPKNWNIYIDVAVEELTPFRPPSSRNQCSSVMAINTRGRGGLIHMGSMLVGLEANDYVLSTGSTFGRVFNSIRTNILDPQCGNCTRLIDLQPGDWIS